MSHKRKKRKERKEEEKTPRRVSVIRRARTRETMSWLLQLGRLGPEIKPLVKNILRIYYSNGAVRFAQCASRVHRKKFLRAKLTNTAMRRRGRQGGGRWNHEELDKSKTTVGQLWLVCVFFCPPTSPPPALALRLSSPYFSLHRAGDGILWSGTRIASIISGRCILLIVRSCVST